MDKYYFQEFRKCMEHYLKEYEELPGIKYVLKKTKSVCNSKAVTTLQKEVYDTLVYELTHDIEVSEKEVREYQYQYLDNIKQQLAEKQRCLVVAPTGAGKTFITFIALSSMIINPAMSYIFMFVSPLLKINEQCIEDVNMRLLTDNRFTKNVKPFVGYQINCKHNNKSEIFTSLKRNENIMLSSTFDSYQKAFEYIKEYNKKHKANKQIHCCVFDECHMIKKEFHNINYEATSKDSDKTKNKWNNIFQNKLITNRIFLSATPNECQITDIKAYKNHLDLYGNKIECINIAELIKQKYLAPITTYRAIVSDNYENEKDNLPRPDTVESIMKMITKYNRKRICVFVNRRANAETLVSTFNKKGYRESHDLKFTLYFDNVGCSEEYFDSKDINDFYKSNETAREVDDPNFEGVRIIFSCKKMCMGVDAPPIDCIVFADPRMNYGEMKQCIGRGLRWFVYPDGSIKDCALLLFTTQKREFDNMMMAFLKFAKNELEYEIIPNNAKLVSTKGKKTSKLKFSEPEPIFTDGKYDGKKVIDVELFERFCSGYNNLSLKQNNNILNNDFSYSVIKECYINNIKYNYESFRLVINYICQNMDLDIIKQKSKLNIVDGEKTDKGYYYLSDINSSIQRISYNKAMSEIINISQVMNISIKLIIELKNKTVVTYEN